MSLTLVEVSPIIILGEKVPSEESGVSNCAEGTNELRVQKQQQGTHLKYDRRGSMLANATKQRGTRPGSLTPWVDRYV